MPRQGRVLSSTGIYHIILRGVNKQDIFFDDQDKYKFTKEIIKTKEKYEYQIFSYCLMPNHVHLEIKAENNTLSKIIQTLGVSYSSYFNKKYERVGHLFQDRYFSKPVENEEYLLKLHQYIHQNPLKAGIDSLDKYKWSSYRKYIYGEEDKITDTELISSYFVNKQDLQKFNNEIINFNYEDILEFEIKHQFTDEEVIRIIQKEIGIQNIQDVQKFNKLHREEVLNKLKKINGIKCAQISRVLGISKKIIERSFKNK